MGVIVFIIVIVIAMGVAIKIHGSESSETLEEKRIREYNESIELAQDFLKNKDQYLILDTETTGLGENDVIVQISIIDLDGNVLLDTLIKPSKRKRINKEATDIHGISMKMLKDQPTFDDIYPKFREITKGKKVLIYNNAFDVRLINQTCEQDEITLDNFTTICMMKLYAVFKNEWVEHRKSYKWPKLPEGDHSSLGDCRSTLDVLHKIANGKKKEMPEK